MEKTNEYGLPETICQLIDYIEGTYTGSKADNAISVTTLLEAPLIRTLYAENKDKIVKDYSNYLSSLIGSVFHEAIANVTSGEGVRAEQRIHLPMVVDGYEFLLNGEFDYADNNSVKDYKHTSIHTLNNAGITAKHEAQLNIYRYMIYKTEGVLLNRLSNIYIFKDWYQSKVGTYNYPPMMIQEVERRVWEIEETEAYILERLRLHLHSPNSCSSKDRWEKEGVPVVYKTSKKTGVKSERAAKVFEAKTPQKEIDDYLNGQRVAHPTFNFDVEVRPAETFVRCRQGYCDMREFCPLFNATKDSE